MIKAMKTGFWIKLPVLRNFGANRTFTVASFNGGGANKTDLAVYDLNVC